MKHTIVNIIAALALAAGMSLAIAQPAAAHHTHSPTTLCRERTLTPPDTLLRAWSTYASNGHPIRANCVIRDSATFRNYQCYFYYDSHNGTCWWI